jgi:quercetin dioxygenase-like cupin family protein
MTPEDPPAPRATHVVWGAIPATHVAPGIDRRLVHGAGVTLLRLALAAGTVLPRHEHPHEQLTTVLAGRLAITLDDEAAGGVIEVAAGDTVAIPGGLPHAARAVTDVVALEVFVPRREDLLG